MTHYNALSIALTLLLAACGGGGGGDEPLPPTAPASIERNVAPLTTDGAITSEFQPHIAINPSPAAALRGRLFVMLPGTGATPNTYREVVRTGAPQGWHAIGLSYPNDDAVGSQCAASADPDCAGNIRRETVTGSDTSPQVSVDRANSIIGRLVSLLRYLSTNFPDEGWDRFLLGSEPNWALISVGGHSQGAGHAAFLGKLVTLERVVMFSGTADPGPGPDGRALWLSFPNVTPADRFYGFTHTADPLASQAAVLSGWRQLGLATFGAPVSVDNNVPPYADSRQLLTSAPPNPMPLGPSAAPAHGAPVADAVTPRDASGAPLLRSVWTFLAFPG
jgi:hypothetical protein